MSFHKDRSNQILDNATEMIGQTPLVYLHKISKNLPATIAVKVEYLNPALSIKDRVGIAMIEDAEKQGLIAPGKTVLIEPTSGNMGIGLAFAAAVKGYKLILTMPSSMSLERRTLLIAYGAALVLTDPARAVEGALEKAEELLKIIPDSYMLNQFANQANVRAHYETTGPEIWKQSQGKVDVVCFGVGSAGTVIGVGKYLKEKNPNIKVYAVEPVESSVINGFKHGPHKIPGMGAGLIPPILDRSVFEEALRVDSIDSLQMAKRLACEEGILSGISGGANVVAASMLAKRPDFKEKLIITSLASFGERYLSTDLYSQIKEDCGKMTIMTVDENIHYLNNALGLNLKKSN